MERGLVPSFLALSLLPPCSTRYWTTGKWSFSAAKYNAVFPSPSVSFLMTPLSMRNCTTSILPSFAAKRNTSLALLFANMIAKDLLANFIGYRSNRPAKQQNQQNHRQKQKNCHNISRICYLEIARNFYENNH